MGKISKEESRIPTELEIKIIAAYGTMRPTSIARMLEIDKSKVYTVLRKYSLPLRSHSKTEGTKYGKELIKKRSNHSQRICKPFKTNQLR
jgi:hypothetical protein